jgi:cell shape-determining protein MreD
MRDREKRIKVIIGLLVLLMLDLTRPFSYALTTEFLFLGIIFMSFNFPAFFSIIVACIFGFIKDCLGMTGTPLNMVEFGLIALMVHYLRTRFHQNVARVMIIVGSFAIHMTLQSTYVQTPSVWFLLIFMIQSFWIFLGVNYLLKKWIKISFVNYI